MNYKETLNYIHSLGLFSHPAGLDRITAVCERLSNPQNDFKAIHIAGTNGKGSVCAFVSSALSESGYNVGTFVSPFITDFCERIQVNGEYISRDDLCRLTQQVIDTGTTLTEFEFITAVVFLYFRERKVDVAVVETGLGGRFDATNILPPPLVSGITKIGLDHTAILGDTIEKITREKCGIIKNQNVVTSHRQTNAALSVIKDYARGVKTPDAKKLTVNEISVLGNSFVYDGTEYITGLGGEYQIENALLAIETLKSCGLITNSNHIKNGLKNAFIPARLEVVSRKPLIVVDGAHNPDGAQALAEALKKYDGCTAVIGVMKDKNYQSVLETTLPFCKNVICVTPTGARSLPAEELASQAKKRCENVFVAKSAEDAISMAKKITNGKPVFVFGSLYLASEIRPLLKEK